MPHKPPLAPVVALLNMKGGVGKTTISAHVMRVLYHRHRIKTLLVDLDPQFNLSQALVSRGTYDKLKDSNRTILTAMEPPPPIGLHDIKTSTSPPPKAEDIVKKLRYIRFSPVCLDLLPGDFRIVKYSMIDNRGKLDIVQQRFLRFIGESRKDYGLICIDCNPSSSFITSCALHACTHIVVPVRPDRYSLLGLEILGDFIDAIPTVNPKPELIILLNGIRRQDEDSAVEYELRAHHTFGPQALTNRLYYSRLLEATAGYTGFATDKPVPWRNLLKKEISAVVDELATRLGIT
ncbi:MAG: ParA family protein [Chloroflexota bacterium]|nr:ParA family protein [Chloroflexota bacterium]